MNRAAMAAIAISASLAVAACGSDDPADSITTTSPIAAAVETTEPDTTEPATTEPPADTTPAATGDGSGDGADDGATAAGSDLVGQWIADVGDVLRTLTAPFGGAPPDCGGPYVIIFGPDGSWASDIDLSCRLGTLDGSGEIGAVGRYTSDGRTFQILDAVPSGALTVAGTPVPIDLDAFFAGFSLPATYTIEGDTLTMDFTTPDGNDHTLQFVRLD
jgi:hypothetical protein